jgi:DNA-binding NarL/FixJ family response regulator
MPNQFHIVEISRALSRHDANAVYTLLREVLPPGVAGRALYELIKTQNDWPTPKHQEDIDAHALLLPSELKVLRYAEKGLSSEEIAHAIPLSVETVKTHKKTIYLKLGVNNIAEAIHVGHELGLFK